MSMLDVESVAVEQDDDEWYAADPPHAWREGAAWREALEGGVPSDVPLISTGGAPSEKAIRLLIEFEVTSPAVYEKKYRRPTWPGGQSGVTIGVGYDVGYCPDKSRLWADWRGVLSDLMVTALERAIGVKGPAARRLAKELGGIVDVPWSAAEQVYRQSILPFWTRVVSGALPNAGMLTGDCFGALLSLSYNRGPSYAKAGDRYREMRAIKAHMGAQAFGRIPGEIRAMRRLWPDVPGLQQRRDREAALFSEGLDNTVAPTLLKATSAPSLDELRQAFADTLAAVADTPAQGALGRRFFFPNGVGELEFEVTVGLEEGFKLSVGVKDAGAAEPQAAGSQTASKTKLEPHIAGMLSADYDYEIQGRFSEDGLEYLLLDQFDAEAGGQLLVRTSTPPEVLAADTILAPPMLRGAGSAWPDHADALDDESETLPLAVDAGQISAAVHRSALACEGKLSSKKVPGTNGGRLGCAWAVNEVVKRALGRPIGGELSTANMNKVLRAKHAPPVAEGDAEPGVIIMSPTSGGKTGHVGIVGERRSGELLVYSNSTERGLFVQNYTVASWRKRYGEKLGLPVLFYRLDADAFPIGRG